MASRSAAGVLEMPGKDLEFFNLLEFRVRNLSLINKNVHQIPVKVKFGNKTFLYNDLYHPKNSKG